MPPAKSKPPAVDPSAKLKLAMELVDVESIHPMKGNARIGDVSTIRESLRKNGQFRALVVRRETQEILAGNHTWKAAKLEKWPHIWVGWVSCSDEEARRINLADNRTAELGSYDEQALADMLGELPDLEGTGWEQSDLDVLLARLSPVGGDEDGPDPSDIPPDSYESQHGVIVLVDDQNQQEAVYETLQRLVKEDPMFVGAELKVVAV